MGLIYQTYRFGEYSMTHQKDQNSKTLRSKTSIWSQSSESAVLDVKDKDNRSLKYLIYWVQHSKHKKHKHKTQNKKKFLPNEEI